MTTRSLKYWYITQDMLLYTYFMLTEIVHVTRDFNKDVNVNVLCIVEKASDSFHTLDAYGCTSSWLSYLKSCVVRKLYLFLLANLLILLKCTTPLICLLASYFSHNKNIWSLTRISFIVKAIMFYFTSILVLKHTHGAY